MFGITLQEFRAIAPRIFVYSAVASAGASVAKAGLRQAGRYLMGAVSAPSETEAPVVERVSKSSMED